MTTDERDAPEAGPAGYGPFDERGRLFHEDDLVAQLALAVTRLEDSLAAERRGLRDLATLRVCTTAPDAGAAIGEVLAERLTVVGATPRVTVDEVAELPVPGMLVSLAATTHPPHQTKEETMTTTHTDTDTDTGVDRRAEALHGLCDGRVHLPGDPGYDAVRLPWNVAVDQRPAAVAVPHSAEEVAAVVRAARAAGLRVAPQSTGHNAAPLAAAGLADVVLLRLSELTGVTVDAERRVARVLGGTLWRDVVAAATPYGLAALHGSAGDVAVAGYALGGGLSWLARSHGLASNSLVAVEVVTAEGTLVRADATQHADLFWAVRGGGGSFGVVVALELELVTLPDVYAGMLLWDREHAPEVVRAWAEWTRTAPESATTSLRVMSFPPLPELPPFLSGRHLVVVDGAVLEDDVRAAEVLSPLRALAPELDTFARIPPPGLLDIHMDPPGPAPAVGAQAPLAVFDDDAVEALLALVGPRTRTAMLFAEVRHLGGALGRAPAGAGALSHLPTPYLLHGIAITPTPEAVALGRDAVHELVEVMAPFTTDGAVLNFSEDPDDAGRAYPAGVWERLRAVRDAVDPARLFRANHEVR